MAWDRARINVRAGTGGAGAVSFRREKHVPLGGPDGGDGGRGGSIILRAVEDLNTLIPFHNRVHYRAENGTHGSGSRKHGAGGRDLMVDVPVGTVVSTDEGRVLADLAEPGREFVVARGGRGGRGNARFKGPRRTAPRIAENGEPGQELWVTLDLKLLADVGLVGAPNAGKSSLLSAASRARPEIAAYPFTTTRPHLGVVSLDVERAMVVADLPGLLEGAHHGVGLGHEFLRHVERTRVLIHVVDLSAPDPWTDFKTVEGEMAAYAGSMGSKPRLVACNKMDLEEARGAWQRLRPRWEDAGLEVFPISAATGDGVRDLLSRAYAVLEQARRDEPEPGSDEPRTVFGPPEPPFSIARADDTWVITGSRVERWAVMTPVDNKEAVRYLLARIRRLGVEDALKQAGATEGDMVRIGQLEFEFRP